jgi:hypothetical protein
VTPLEGRRPKLRTVLLAGAGVIIVAVTLRVPLATVFTLGLLLICPLLMVGMHGGGHGTGHTSADGVHADPTDRTGDQGRSAPLTLPSRHEPGLGCDAAHERPEVPS